MRWSLTTRRTKDLERWASECPLEPRELSSSRGNVRLLVLSSGFVALGVSGLLWTDSPIIGGVVTVFGALGLAASLMRLGQPGTLTLDQHGFTFKQPPRTVFTEKWEDCSSFRVFRPGPMGAGMASWDSAASKVSNPRMSAVARGLAGVSSALPPTAGGLPTSALVTLLNRYHQAYSAEPR